MRQPVVRLYRNPWAATLTNDVVLEILLTAALKAEEELQRLIAADEVEEGRDSYGAVLLDPTRPRSAVTFNDHVLAIIELGPNGAKYVPNGAAKADAHDRHGVPNSQLVNFYNHCLGDEDFGWGNSFEYQHAIGGGSGLSPLQDGALVLVMLKHLVESVQSRRQAWLAERRRNGSHGWYNPGNTPGAEYAAVLSMTPIATLTHGGDAMQWTPYIAPTS